MSDLPHPLHAALEALTAATGEEAPYAERGITGPMLDARMLNAGALDWTQLRQGIGARALADLTRMGRARLVSTRGYRRWAVTADTPATRPPDD